jgi:hypothetical protein
VIVVVEGVRTAVERARVGRVTVYSIVVNVSGEGVSKTVNANVVRVEVDGEVVASADAEGAVPHVLLAVRTDYARIEIADYDRLSVYTKA